MDGVITLVFIVLLLLTIWLPTYIAIYLTIVCLFLVRYKLKCVYAL